MQGMRTICRVALIVESNRAESWVEQKEWSRGE